jgi:Asp-tRNA(Asn)/Glu-tRNA(Gln) amidotransferase A subunit family amidase
MTDEEREIKAWERKLTAQIRKNKIKMSKKLLAMTSEEMQAYWEKGAEELRAKGIKVVYSVE